MALGALGRLLGIGGGQNVITSTITGVAGVFNPNAEAESKREWEARNATLQQYGAEFFDRQHRTWFDAFVDGLNRMIRPTLVILFVFLVPYMAFTAPAATAAAFEILALLPAEYWFITGSIVLFFFGGRMQAKAHELRAQLSESAKALKAVKPVVQKARGIEHDQPLLAEAKAEDLIEDKEDDANPIVSWWNKNVSQ